MGTRNRFLLEACVVVTLGIAISVLLYSDWFRDCCRDSTGALVGVALLPAAFIAMIIGDGIHNASRAHFTIGVVLQLWLLWLLAHATWRLMIKRRRDHAAQPHAETDGSARGGPAA